MTGRPCVSDKATKIRDEHTHGTTSSPPDAAPRRSTAPHPSARSDRLRQCRRGPRRGRRGARRASGGGRRRRRPARLPGRAAGPGRRSLVGSYHRMLERAPWTWKRLYEPGQPARRRHAGRAVHLPGRTPDEGDPARGHQHHCLHLPAGQPGAGAAGRGKVEQPVHTYLTDFSVHALWTCADVDAHLAIHQVPAAQARAGGCGGVSVIAPVVDRRFTPVTRACAAPPAPAWACPRTPGWRCWSAALGSGRDRAHRRRHRGGRPRDHLRGGLRPQRDPARAAARRRRPARLRLGGDMPSLTHASGVLVQNAAG